MIKLNLKANGIEQEKIKEYLENNASELLADKINNGVKITKDNKILINKKDLSTFISYASGEARKLIKNNEHCACVDDATVFGWAIHYFEEESIEGTLYNEDGTEYKTISKIPTTPPKTQVKKEKPKEEKLQATLFDMLVNAETAEEIEEIIEDEIANESQQETVEETETIEELEQEIEVADLPIEEKQKENLMIDIETGEALTNNEQISSFDDDVATSLFSIFQNILEVK